MAAVKSKNTKPEMQVRKILHSLGYRFRLHRKDLPGKPDIVLPKFKTVIFINGCFWHQHVGCKHASIPQTNTEFWEKKLSNNVERDRKNYQALFDMGWKVLVIWECEVKKLISDKVRLNEILNEESISKKNVSKFM